MCWRALRSGKIFDNREAEDEEGSEGEGEPAEVAFDEGHHARTEAADEFCHDEKTQPAAEDRGCDKNAQGDLEHACADREHFIGNGREAGGEHRQESVVLVESLDALEVVWRLYI